MAEPRGVHRRVALALAVAALASGLPGVTMAAVEPALYLNPDKGAPGATVVLSSAADYLVCFSSSGDQEPADWPVGLAPADQSSPGPADLIMLVGSWSEQDGAVAFEFRVPSIPPGKYRAHVSCDDGTLDPSAPRLSVVGSVPATDALPSAPTDRPDPTSTLAAAALLGLLLGSRMIGRRRRRQAKRH